MQKTVVISGVAAVLSVVVVCLSLHSSPVEAQAAGPWERALREFFSQIQMNNDLAAARFLVTQNRWAGAAPAIEELNDKLAALRTHGGKFLRYDVLASKEIAGRCAMAYVLVCYENFPVAFTFEMYRPKDSWLLRSMEIHTDVADRMRQGLIEQVYMK